MDLSVLTDLANLVRQLSGSIIPSNRPVVGDMLYNVESGIITSWVRNCGQADMTEVFPFRSEMVGNKPVEVVLGKGSGVDSIKYWLDKLNMGQASEADVMAMLVKVKAFSLENKRLLTADEFQKIAASVLDAAGA
jgi:isopropylmalate/homocitrate/citramalate synthase